MPAPRVVFAVAFFGPVIGPGVGVGSARPRETRDQSGSCWGDDEESGSGQFRLIILWSPLRASL